jgi:hypothetical protein
MANLQPEKLITEEFLALQEMLGNGALMSGLRKIFVASELERLNAMRSEALGPARAVEIVRQAAESRAYSEWEATVRKGMERLGQKIR